MRPVSFSMRNDATRMSVSVTDLKSVVAMLREITAAQPAASPRRSVDGAGDRSRSGSDAEGGDVGAHAVAPRAARGGARHRPRVGAVRPAAGQVTAGTVTADLGVRGHAGGPVSTFVARRERAVGRRHPARRRRHRPPTKIVNVAPIYPQEAQDAKVQGVVVIETVIDEAGAVKEAWVLKSVPLLDEPALEAVRQWRYQPTLMNGVPRPVRMTVTVNFTLAP